MCPPQARIHAWDSDRLALFVTCALLTHFPCRNFLPPFTLSCSSLNIFLVPALEYVFFYRPGTVLLHRTSLIGQMHASYNIGCGPKHPIPGLRPLLVVQFNCREEDPEPSQQQEVSQSRRVLWYAGNYIYIYIIFKCMLLNRAGHTD